MKDEKDGEKGICKAHISHTCDRQTFLNNTNARIPVPYFQRAIFLTFLDNLLEQINACFNGPSEAALL